MKRLLIGASMAAIALELGVALPAAAGTLKPTNVQFNTTNINTWLYSNPNSPTMETVQGVSRRTLDDFNNYGNTAKAIQALTDNDASTNVELWTNGETITDNVGFTAQLGKNTIRVESVTQTDWATGTLAKSWLDGFLVAFDSYLTADMKTSVSSNYDNMLTALKTKGLFSSGDPNIGDVRFDTDSNELTVDLVGHLDRASLYVDTRQTITDTRATIKDTRATVVDTRVTVLDTRKTINGKANPTYNKQISNPTYNQTIANPNLNKSMPNPTYNQQIANANYLKAKNDARYATGNMLLDSMVASLAASVVRDGKQFQMSEIAKITFNDKVDYAFSFAATDSGAIAGDRNKTSDFTSHTGVYTWKKTVTNRIPEPSAILGCLTVVGLAYRSRRNRTAAE
jgi:hypothetical protein